MTTGARTPHRSSVHLFWLPLGADGNPMASPVRLCVTESQTRAVLDLVPCCPTPTWGLDELDTGEMWNSNSVVAWLLALSGLVTPGLAAPARGRAPGWRAGLRAAQLQLRR